MKHKMRTCIILGSCLLITGCGRVIDWGKTLCGQGTPLDVDLKSPRSYVRSTVIHDQFSTSAIFDALWLSDVVRTAFTNITSLKRGKNEESRLAFLRRQLEENKHYITLYVLNTYNLPAFSDPLSEWSLALEVDGVVYMPSEIKAVDLDPIYQAFFYKRYNDFKIPYKVSFDAKDAHGQWIITPQTERITLIFRSIYKEARLHWIIKPEDVESQLIAQRG